MGQRLLQGSDGETLGQDEATYGQIWRNVLADVRRTKRTGDSFISVHSLHRRSNQIFRVIKKTSLIVQCFCTAQIFSISGEIVLFLFAPFHTSAGYLYKIKTDKV